MQREILIKFAKANQRHFPYSFFDFQPPGDLLIEPCDQKQIGQIGPTVSSSSSFSPVFRPGQKTEYSAEYRLGQDHTSWCKLLSASLSTKPLPVQPITLVNEPSNKPMKTIVPYGKKEESMLPPGDVVSHTCVCVQKHHNIHLRVLWSL